MIHDLSPDKLHEAAQLAAEASVIAEAPASPANEARGARGIPASKPPAGHAWSLHDSIRQRVRGCMTDTQLQAVINWAKREIKGAKIRQADRESTADMERRILKEEVGVDAVVVARQEGESTKTIRDLRTRNGRNPRTGEHVGDVNMSEANEAERRAKIAELLDQGISQRQIRIKLSLTEWTVSRDVTRIRAERRREAA